MIEQVFEVDGDKVQFWALSREGVWLCLFEIPNTSADEIWNVYRVPLLLKLEYAGQEAPLVVDSPCDAIPQDARS